MTYAFDAYRTSEKRFSRHYSVLHLPVRAIIRGKHLLQRPLMMLWLRCLRRLGWMLRVDTRGGR